MKNVSNDSGIGSWIRKELILVREAFRDVKDRLSQAQSVRLMAALGLMVIMLSLVVWEFEKGPAAALTGDEASSRINSLGKAIYWAIISGTTVGYGDVTPRTPWGRGLTAALILCSMVLTSILTATIASWLVEKRIMEGRGMERVTWRGHIVVCGWNVNAKEIVEAIYRDTKDSARVVLINNLHEEEISEVVYLFKRQGLRFVRGDFTHENVLERANVIGADTVIILADGSVDAGFTGSDQRTVLCALALKSINPAIKVSAELVDEDNVPLLKRAQVDHIVVMGEYNDFLLANSVTSPGVTLAVQDLLNAERGSSIQEVRIPSNLVDQPFSELAHHFRDKRGAMVIGVVSKKEQGMSLDDILSDDMSAIDLFIKSQFQGMEEDYFSKGHSTKIRINPPDEYKVDKNDRALLIGAVEEAGGGSA